MGFFPPYEAWESKFKCDFKKRKFYMTQTGSRCPEPVELWHSLLGDVVRIKEAQKGKRGRMQIGNYLDIQVG